MDLDAIRGYSKHISTVARKEQKMENLKYEDLGPQDGYDRVLRTTVNGNKVTLCFNDESQGENVQNIVKLLKDSYQERVERWT